jgi:hypothetical protein
VTTCPFLLRFGWPRTGARTRFRHAGIVRESRSARDAVLPEATPKAPSVAWKGLYAGRRGACTAVIEATGGNYAVAQALLSHKTMDTTLRVYKKQITPQGLLAGMQQFQKTLGK